MLKHELNFFLNFSYENAANSMSWRKPTSRVWPAELFTSAATSSWRPTASLERYRFNQETYQQLFYWNLLINCRLMLFYNNKIHGQMMPYNFKTESYLMQIWNNTGLSKKLSNDYFAAIFIFVVNWCWNYSQRFMDVQYNLQF